MNKIKSRMRNAAIACCITQLALPVNAATSFPDNPLLSQNKRIPPNILMVLDDSGSMAWEYMPDKDPNGGSWPTFLRKNPNVNPLAYDPRKADYKPWMTWTGARLTLGQSYSAVYDDDTLAKTADDVALSTVADLRSTSKTVLFYLPKSTSVASGDTSQSNYYEYSVKFTQSSGIWSAPVVRQCSWSSGSNSFTSGCVIVATPATASVTVSSRATWDIELANYATWYSYQRTRNKMAKAGAAEGFGKLDDNYRVGFDTIWNRDWKTNTDGSGGNPSGSSPALPIPTGAGLFSGANRQAWFNQLFYSQASNGTPLKGALQRAGRYYQTKAPWNSVDDKGAATYLACRQAFTILTTDGFWNDSSGFNSIGDVDGANGPVYTATDGTTTGGYKAGPPYKDGASVSYSDTLADVAMYFWEHDLRTDLPDAVPATTQDPAFWQHMSTFAISIGAQGTLNQTTDWPKLQKQQINWPQPVADSLTAIDDLWHAAVNGHGQFTPATSPDIFAQALSNALGSITGRTASGSNLASNGPYATTNSYKYSAIYHSSQYWGDLRAFPRNATNVGYSSTPTWLLSTVVNADANFLTRPVLTWNGSMGASFVATHLADSTFAPAARPLVTAPANLNYLIGDRTNESLLPDVYRKRQLSPIGDIVDSTPVFVNDSGYLFVGANDGMLHGIDSRTGKVGFSYVPAGINFSDMASLSDPAYTHKFFVDGQLYVSKIQNAGDKNYLVGTLGRGGRGVFALDVSTPTSAGMTASKVLWDKSFQTGAAGAVADMGYVLGSPTIKKGQDGKTIALVPNGIESDSGKAALFMYDMTTGTSTELVADAGSGNGLMTLETADLDGDGKIDLVYGGDLKGNLWRWDLRVATPTAVKLFTATSPSPAGNLQAITGGITVAREGSTGNIFVAFGTGRLISSGDLPWDTTNAGQHADTQSIYGLIDNLASDSTATISGRAQLKQRTFPYTGTDSAGHAARSPEVYSALPSGVRGWYIDLGVPTPFANGERVISAPVIDGRVLAINSMWPKQASSDCNSSAGDGYQNAFDVFTGTNPSITGDAGGTYGYFDINGNSQKDDKLASYVNASGQVVTGSPTGSAGADGFVGSVSNGGAPGKADVSDQDVCVQQDNGQLVCTKKNQPGGTAHPERLIWRELINHG
ncbi:pilus assembly protein [Solilutibacter silvestris]|nr:PilC/PilY family type IV pilus protein [Lysobacter silvestris]